MRSAGDTSEDHEWFQPLRAHSSWLVASRHEIRSSGAALVQAHSARPPLPWPPWAWPRWALPPRWAWPLRSWPRAIRALHDQRLSAWERHIPPAPGRSPRRTFRRAVLPDAADGGSPCTALQQPTAHPDHDALASGNVSRSGGTIPASARVRSARRSGSPSSTLGPSSVPTTQSPHAMSRIAHRSQSISMPAPSARAPSAGSHESAR